MTTNNGMPPRPEGGYDDNWVAWGHSDTYTRTKSGKHHHSSSHHHKHHHHHHHRGRRIAVTIIVIVVVLAAAYVAARYFGLV